MRVLAVDCATTFGWACDNPSGDRPLGGAVRLRSDDVDDAYTEFRQHLREIIQVHQPDVLAYEAPLPVAMGSNFANIMARAATIRKLQGLVAHAGQLGTTLREPPVEAEVSTIRKHFCGNGRAKKDEVQARCRLLGWQFVDDNQADALALWCYVKAMLEPTWSPNSTPLFGRAS